MKALTQVMTTKFLFELFNQKMLKTLSGIVLIIVGVFGILTPFTPFGIPSLLAGLALLRWRRSEPR